MIPDHRCEKHGTLLAVSRRKEGGYHRYCNACRREKASAFHYDGPTCRRGHLKTPWSWRLNNSSGWYRCMICEGLRRRERRQRKKAA